MKKNFFYLMLLFSAVTFFSACSEDGEVVNLPATTFKEASLVLNYSEVPVLGKTAIVSITANKVEIKLSSNVIPGVPELVLSADIVGSGEEFTFESETVVAENNVTYSGSIKDDVCTVNLAVVIPTTALAQKWHVYSGARNFPDGAPMVNDWAVPIEGATADESLISIKKWVTLDGTLGMNVSEVATTPDDFQEIPVAFFTKFLNNLVGVAVGMTITPLIKDVEFLNDGNIVVTINMAEEGAEVPPVWVPTPKGIAMYKVDNDNTIRLFINPVAIVGTLSPAVRATNAGGGIEALIASVLANGIPIKYKIEEGPLKPAKPVAGAGDVKYVRFYLDKAFISPLLPVITPLLGMLTKEDIDDILGMGDGLSYMILNIIKTVNNGLEKTTDMEISFNLLDLAPLSE